MWSVLLILLVFYVVLLCVFTSLVACCDVCYNFRIKKCSVLLYLQSPVGVLMSCRVFVYFCVYIDVQYFAVALLFSFLYNVLFQVVPVA